MSTAALASGTEVAPPVLVPSYARIELKREATSRGTEEESTKTILRFERFLEGPVRFVRLDLPFPDEQTDFNGSPFHPRRGDIKTRVAFRPLQSGDFLFPSFVEATFPTADPASLGSGKYQLSAGLRALTRIHPSFFEPTLHRVLLEGEVQQVNSVAGDDSRKDINATKFEFNLNDLWRNTYTAKLKLKPSLDWVQDKTGAVVELEGGRFFARHWRAWLMLGHRLWGPEGVYGTYSTRAELGLAWSY